MLLKGQPLQVGSSLLPDSRLIPSPKSMVRVVRAAYQYPFGIGSPLHPDSRLIPSPKTMVVRAAYQYPFRIERLHKVKGAIDADVKGYPSKSEGWPLLVDGSSALSYLTVLIQLDGTLG